MAMAAQLAAAFPPGFWPARNTKLADNRNACRQLHNRGLWGASNLDSDRTAAWIHVQVAASPFDAAAAGAMVAQGLVAPGAAQVRELSVGQLNLLFGPDVATPLTLAQNRMRSTMAATRLVIRPPPQLTGGTERWVCAGAAEAYLADYLLDASTHANPLHVRHYYKGEIGNAEANDLECGELFINARVGGTYGAVGGTAWANGRNGCPVVVTGTCWHHGAANILDATEQVGKIQFITRGGLQCVVLGTPYLLSNGEWTLADRLIEGPLGAGGVPLAAPLQPDQLSARTFGELHAAGWRFGLLEAAVVGGLGLVGMCGGLGFYCIDASHSRFEIKPSRSQKCAKVRVAEAGKGCKPGRLDEESRVAHANKSGGGMGPPGNTATRACRPSPARPPPAARPPLPAAGPEHLSARVPSTAPLPPPTPPAASARVAQRLSTARSP